MGRKQLPKLMQARVYVRDGFSCRYCGTDLFFGPALKALGGQYGGHAYYDKNGHRDRMSKMLLDHTGCVDHVRPVSSGGENLLENLVCACWSCNTAKSASMGVDWSKKLEVQRRRTPHWDGMLAVLAATTPTDPWLQAFRAIGFLC